MFTVQVHSLPSYGIGQKVLVKGFTPPQDGAGYVMEYIPVIGQDRTLWQYGILMCPEGEPMNFETYDSVDTHKRGYAIVVEDEELEPLDVNPLQ